MLKTRDITKISMFTVIIFICSYITIPAVVPFTMQTFAIMIAILIQGGKKAFYSCLAYILLFKNVMIMTPTGGYLIGFLFMCVFCNVFDKKINSKFIMLLLSNFICYIFGTIWFVIFYTNAVEQITLLKTLSICVVPFVIPDILKIVLAIKAEKLIKNKMQ